MKELKIALIWTIWDIQQTLIFKLIEHLSNKKIVIVQPSKADLIIYGPYNWNEKFFQIYKFLKKKNFSRKNEKIHR